MTLARLKGWKNGDKLGNEINNQWDSRGIASFIWYQNPFIRKKKILIHNVNETCLNCKTNLGRFI